MNTTFELFSPRWGHNDTYTVDMQPDHMEVSMDMRTARGTPAESRSGVERRGHRKYFVE
nr:hypothetical protein [Burkholderia multivorans]